MARTVNRNANPICRLNGLPQKSTRAVATDSKVKSKVFRPMSKVERKIWKLQRSKKLLASQRAFQECIKSKLADFKKDTGQFPNRIAANAIEGLQSVSENFLTHLFTDSMRAIEHAKRRTLMVGDLILAIRLRGYDQTVLKDWEPLPGRVSRERGRAQN